MPYNILHLFRKALTNGYRDVVKAKSTSWLTALFILQESSFAFASDDRRRRRRRRQEVGKH